MNLNITHLDMSKPIYKIIVAIVRISKAVDLIHDTLRNIITNSANLNNFVVIITKIADNADIVAKSANIAVTSADTILTIANSTDNVELSAKTANFAKIVASHAARIASLARTTASRLSTTI